MTQSPTWWLSACAYSPETPAVLSLTGCLQRGKTASSQELEEKLEYIRYVRAYVHVTAAIHDVLPTLCVVMAAVGECHGLNHSSPATLPSYLLRCKKSLHKT